MDGTSSSKFQKDKQESLLPEQRHKCDSRSDGAKTQAQCSREGKVAGRSLTAWYATVKSHETHEVRALVKQRTQV